MIIVSLNTMSQECFAVLKFFAGKLVLFDNRQGLKQRASNSRVGEMSSGNHFPKFYIRLNNGNGGQLNVNSDLEWMELRGVIRVAPSY